jgi:hypothetical protein
MLGIKHKPMHATAEAESHGIAQRRDVVTERAVNRGISLQYSVGTLCAMEYLRAEGVPRSVAQRVLSEPNQRRRRA